MQDIHEKEQATRIELLEYIRDYYYKEDMYSYGMMLSLIDDLNIIHGLSDREQGMLKIMAQSYYKKNREVIDKKVTSNLNKFVKSFNSRENNDS